MSWEQLLAIQQEWDEIVQQAEEERSHPKACPNDGEPMREGPHGELYCVFDGYQPP